MRFDVGVLVLTKHQDLRYTRHAQVYGVPVSAKAKFKAVYEHRLHVIWQLSQISTHPDTHKQLRIVFTRITQISSR